MRTVHMLRAAAVTAGLLVFAVSGGSRAEKAPPTSPTPPPMPADLFDMPIPVPPPPPPIPPADAVAAVINGVELQQATVNEYIARAIRGSGQELPPERENEIRGMLNEQITDDLVTQMILEQAADAQNIAVTDAQVDEAIAQIPLPEGVTLEKAMEEQGMTRDALVRDIRRALKIDQLLKSHAEKAPGPTDEEIKAFYEENKERFEQPETVTASHILIRVPEDADEATKAEKKAKIENIRKELVDGADFAEAAKTYSEDPGSKDRGGEYTFPRGMMAKAFEEAAYTQELNAIGPPIETNFGYHIIKTTAKTPAGTVPLEEAAPRLKEMLDRRGKGELVRAYIDELREKAKIEYPGRPAAEPKAEEPKKEE